MTNKFKVGDKVIPNQNYETDGGEYGPPQALGVGNVIEVKADSIIAEFDTEAYSDLEDEEEYSDNALKPFSFKLNQLTIVDDQVQTSLNEIFDDYQKGLALIQKSIKNSKNLSSNINVICDVSGLEDLISDAGWRTSSLYC